ncbi:hypothetical protein BTUL_0191g00220 [Botrytis tulipae]|uniref:Uncharacterized protein n=1 Tax=Botrytis tulipae TaxID=87230 RepID=A0A4Z1EDK5_9HELO|nr:hypothetical protein BTUL_0191g00220 [Botrytis tulipae]
MTILSFCYAWSRDSFDTSWRGELMAISGMTSSYVHMQNSLRKTRQRGQRLHGTGMVQNGG